MYAEYYVTLLAWIRFAYSQKVRPSIKLCSGVAASRLKAFERGGVVQKDREEETNTIREEDEEQENQRSFDKDDVNKLLNLIYLLYTCILTVHAWWKVCFFNTYLYFKVYRSIF